MALMRETVRRDNFATCMSSSVSSTEWLKKIDDIEKVKFNITYT